jgi:hypothetical protein
MAADYEGGDFLDQLEFRRLLDSLGSFEKAANRDMRREAEYIADSIMVPAIQSAISSHAPGYARKLNASIRTKQDRVPSVKVGNSTKFSSRGNPTNPRANTGRGVYSGGATTNMIRFGTIKGQYTSRSGKTQFWAEGIRPGWTDTADADYYEPAFAAWTNTAEKLIDDWNRGSDY